MSTTNALADHAHRIIAREPGITKRHLRDRLGVSLGVTAAVTGELKDAGLIRIERGGAETTYWPGGSA